MVACPPALSASSTRPESVGPFDNRRRSAWRIGDRGAVSECDALEGFGQLVVPFSRQVFAVLVTDLSTINGNGDRQRQSQRPQVDAPDFGGKVAWQAHEPTDRLILLGACGDLLVQCADFLLWLPECRDEIDLMPELANLAPLRRSLPASRAEPCRLRPVIGTAAGLHRDTAPQLGGEEGENLPRLHGNCQAPRAGAPVPSMCGGLCPSPSAASARCSASTARPSARRCGAGGTGTGYNTGRPDGLCAAFAHPPQRWGCPPSGPGLPCRAHRPRPPPKPWRLDRCCTNIRCGPLGGGRSGRLNNITRPPGGGLRLQARRAGCGFQRANQLGHLVPDGERQYRQ